MRQKVDPAALLVGVFAVGAGPLFQSGLWALVNTITALVVLVVVLYFTWPHKAVRATERMTAAGCLAYASVYAFIVGIAFAYPAQQTIAWFRPKSACGDASAATSTLDYLKVSDCWVDFDTKTALNGSTGALVVGAVALVVGFLVLMHLHRPSGSKHDASPYPEKAGSDAPSKAPASESASS